MKKYFETHYINWEVVIATVLATAVFIFTVLYACGVFNHEEPEPEIITVEVEVEAETNWDTTALDGWCGEPNGKIRMVGGWAYCDDVIEDETGNLWGYSTTDPDAFYLLWIDDNGTPDFVQDDEIVKVWEENH